MADAARRLLAALREAEPRAVEELLRLGADPSLVLEDGAAAVHLAARARHPRALYCLRILLRRGANPNARTGSGPWTGRGSKAITTAHACCRTWTRPPEPKRRPRGPPVSRAEGGARNLCTVVVEPQSPEATGSPDCTSDASFVTALEDSLQPRLPVGSPGPAGSPWLSCEAKVAGDGAPSCQLQALTLTTEATNVPSLPGDGDPGALHPHGPVPPMSDLQLLQALRALGYSPGPVTPFTRGHYLRRLQEAQASPGHSPELAEALRTGHIPDCQADEAALTQHFQQLDPAKRWREGGTRTRPDAHLWEALGYRERPGKKACPKVCRILDIWDSGRGVISLHCFQHVVAMEAYTREACLLDALGIQTLTNQKQGHYYGEVAYWPLMQRRRLGVHLLHRALLVFLAEGERELRPQDIQARG
ncbi:hypothetical protein A6R68_10491 [Neotoma lepida]|uniref:LEM domain-containing protein n=1 Tax=Neotoma lepida TaxID=56216 RepID=A0A1A6FYY2_NEOLE|nr:hypothetical protein A6R68_10491 [Neotoma lepida]